MDKVPKMISTKDLSYISDMLNHNFYLAKKVNEYLTLIEDADVKKVLEKAHSNIKNNYTNLLKLLK